MKRFALLLLCFFAWHSTRSQDLAYTEWLGTNFPSPNVWLYFGADTVSYSFTGSSYTPMSWYSAVDGDFAILDLPGISFCTDTGRYIYAINSGHMAFTLVNDACVSRKNTLVNYDWLQLATGVDPQNRATAAQVFPNPSNGFFHLLVPESMMGGAEVVLFDQSGKEVFRQHITSRQADVDISFLPPGIYYGQCLDESVVCSFFIAR